LWVFAVSSTACVIFRFLAEDKVLLIDVGGHDEVY
jgi:hypothetical protein